MVLTMDGGPFLGDHAGRQPQPEAEEMRYERMQLECAMRLAAVEIDGHRRDGDVRQCKRGKRVPPPGEIQQTGKQHRFEWPLINDYVGAAILRGMRMQSPKDM